MAWQTIDTAPKTGEAILVKRLDGCYPFVIRWVHGKWWRTWDAQAFTPTDGDVWHVLPTDDREQADNRPKDHGKGNAAFQVGDTRQVTGMLARVSDDTEMWIGDRWVHVSDDTVALAAVLRALH